MAADSFERGRRAFRQGLGLNRRDFLRASIAAPAIGALYFGYRSLQRPVRAGIVGTGNEGCQAMIEQSPPGYLQYVAYHDIRPSQVARGRKEFLKLYGNEDGKRVKFYDKWEEMLRDPDIEAIVIATPLWTHAKLAIEAMEAGKHVLCEKLMAHNITDAKAMVRVAEKERRILSIGHQRHYSTLYADAAETIRSGVLGDIRHIRALWHRNNARPILDAQGKPTGNYADSWRPEIPKDDLAVNAKAFGYKDVNELVRWRLYDRTGGGLMAELGSHQLDACSIFVHACSESAEKPRPLAVTGMGGKHFFNDDRECEDHVYCSFEFPGKGFISNRDPRDNDVVVVTYSSINTNAMEGYGEIVMGTRGTMMVLQERDVAIYDENDPQKAAREAVRAKYLQQQQAAKGQSGTDVKVGTASKGEATMYSAASLGVTAQAKSASTEVVSRGYREELEHFAYCIRHPDPENKVHCDGRVALADNVMANTATLAIRTGKRIVMKPEWFDPRSKEVPDNPPGDVTLGNKAWS